MASENGEIVDLPTAVHTGEFQLGGVTMRVHVLDDGRRVIDAESVHAFLDALENGPTITPEQADAFARFIRGK